MADKPGPSREVLDRLRRIETRLIRYMIAQGFDTETMVPTFQSGVLDIPSIACSLKDMLDAVPADYTGKVIVLHRSLEVAILTPVRR